MLKVILDTNVLVSSLIQRSSPFLVIQFIIKTKEIKLCISNSLWQEYDEVLSREKFMKYPFFVENAKDLLVDFKEKAENYFPTVILDILEDQSDNRFLELAETCNADYIITGNTKHFPMKEYKGTRIVSPREFWEVVNKTI